MERSKTHIDVLDKNLNGGIPQGHVVLLYGPPGTGKTTFGLQYLINGAKFDNEKGLYLTIVENELKVMKNFSEFKFFDQKIIDQNLVEIIDLRFASSAGTSKRKRFIFFDTLDLFEFLKDKVIDSGAKRIVIDSVTGLATFIKNPQDFRDFFFFLSNIIAELKCTAILIGEESGLSSSTQQIENFMSDGLIRLDQIEKNNVLTKTLEIVKMRGTAHSSDKMRLDIKTNGINLLPLIQDK